MQFSATPHRTRGFSLIELMVGIVVALLTTVVIFRSYQAYEGQRRTNSAASDAVGNGQFVLQQLDRDIAQAGWGFQYGKQGVGCDFSAGFALNSSAGVFLPNAATATRPANLGQMVLVPVMIADGSTTTGGSQYAPDAIRIMHSRSETGVPYSGSVIGTTPNTFTPTSVVGMTQGDMLLMMDPGTRTCQFGQITNAIPTTTTGLVMASGTGPCQSTTRGGTCTAGSALNKAAALATASWAVNFGTFTVNTYTVTGNTMTSNSAVLGNTYDPISALHPLLTSPGYISNSTGTSLVSELSQDVVNIQAQYGIDTVKNVISSTTDPAKVSVVASNGWVNATGNYAPNQLNAVTANGVITAQQIRAIRILIVTRSALPEKKDPSTGNCSATADSGLPAGNNIKRLTWPNGDTIDVDLAQGATSTTWNCYRYQYFMNVIPLRNTIWNAMDYEK